VGAGRFTDVTKTAGVADRGFSTSALWFDTTTTAGLDLFVARTWVVDRRI
jgi:hypothetical protein